MVVEHDSTDLDDKLHKPFVTQAHAHLNVISNLLLTLDVNIDNDGRQKMGLLEEMQVFEDNVQQ